MGNVKNRLLLVNAPAQERVFTTGQVARMCRVAPRTVSKWFDAGRLKGYRIPGSDDRRVPLGALRVFARDSGIPLVGLDDDTVVLCGLGRVEADAARADLHPRGVSVCDSAFAAGVRLGGPNPPGVVVADAAEGTATLRQIAALLTADPRFGGTELVAVVGVDAEVGLATVLVAAGVDRVVARPVDWAAVLGTPGREK